MAPAEARRDGLMALWGIIDMVLLLRFGLLAAGIFVALTVVLLAALRIHRYHPGRAERRALRCPQPWVALTVEREQWVAAWTDVRAFEHAIGHPSITAYPAYAQPGVTPEQAAVMDLGAARTEILHRAARIQAEASRRGLPCVGLDAALAAAEKQRREESDNARHRAGNYYSPARIVHPGTRAWIGATEVDFDG